MTCMDLQEHWGPLRTGLPGSTGVHVSHAVPPTVLALACVVPDLGPDCEHGKYRFIQYIYHLGQKKINVRYLENFVGAIYW